MEFIRLRICYQYGAQENFLYLPYEDTNIEKTVFFPLKNTLLMIVNLFGPQCDGE